MLGKELRPGHMTTFGLVLAVHHEPHGIYEADPSIHWMEVQDPFYGGCSSTLQLEDEYEILYEEGTPQYREKVKYMIRCRADAAKHASKDIEELLQYIK